MIFVCFCLSHSYECIQSVDLWEFLLGAKCEWKCAIIHSFDWEKFQYKCLREWHFVVVISRWTLRHFATKSNSSQHLEHKFRIKIILIDFVLNESLRMGSFDNSLFIASWSHFAVEKQLHFLGPITLLERREKNETSLFRVLLPFVSF